MKFEEGHLYHIFNRGVAKREIFFHDENYLYFLRKIRTHIAPHGRILAYCLMPNHFHIMMQVDKFQVDYKTKNEVLVNRTLNASIGIMLRSYTIAIQKQESFIGSLFEQHTSANCLTTNTKLTPAFLNAFFGTMIQTAIPEKQYPALCFDYIHDNPLKAGLVRRPEQWIYSSLIDYLGLRNGTLINKILAKELGLI